MVTRVIRVIRVIRLMLGLMLEFMLGLLRLLELSG
jgi:hypothetical protein